MKKLVLRAASVLCAVLFLWGCGGSSQSIIISDYNNSAPLVDTTDYNDYWTNFILYKPEAAKQYTNETYKLMLADGFNHVINCDYEKAIPLLGEVYQKTDNDTIRDVSRDLCDQAIRVSEKWNSYKEYLRKPDDTDSTFNNRYSFAELFSANNPSYIFDKERDTIDMILSHGMIIGKVFLNGKELELIFDTGAEFTILSQSIADDYGVKSSRYALNLSGSTGHATDSHISLIDSIRIGSFLGLKHPVIVAPDASMKAKFWFITFYSFDGLIGYDLIKKLDIEFDCVNQKIYINKPKHLQTENKNLFCIRHPMVKLKALDGTDVFAMLDMGAQDSKGYNNLCAKIETDKIDEGDQTYYGIGGKRVEDYIVVDSINVVSNNKHILFQGLKVTGYDYDEERFRFYDIVIGADLFYTRRIRIDGTNGIFEIK